MNGWHDGAKPTATGMTSGMVRDTESEPRPHAVKTECFEIEPLTEVRRMPHIL